MAIHDSNMTFRFPYQVNIHEHWYITRYTYTTAVSHAFAIQPVITGLFRESPFRESAFRESVLSSVF